MNIELGLNKKVRRAYGIDEIALVPGNRTIDYDLTDPSWSIGNLKREVPIVASAMDSVVDVNTAVELTKLGALGVINVEGIQTRYDNPEEILSQIVSVGKNDFVPLMQKIYSEPIKEELILQRINEVKEKGGIAAFSGTPQAAIPPFSLTSFILCNINSSFTGSLYIFCINGTKSFFPTDAIWFNISSGFSYRVCMPSILITPRDPNFVSSTAVLTSTTLSIALATIGTSLLKSPIDQEGSVKS